MDISNNIYWSEDLSPLALDWFCPFCNTGHLELDKERLLMEEYEHSKKNHGHRDFEGSWVQSSCAGILICNNRRCREYVSFCGTAQGEDFEVDDPESPDGTAQVTRDVITPLLVFPSPHFVKMSDQYPKAVSTHLKETFSLFWLDKMSCANKLRVVAEDVLNHYRIPRTRVDRNHRRRQISTHDRLILLQQNPRYREAARYLLAIKWIGNLGSHAGTFNGAVLLKAFQLVEKALDLLFIGSDEELRRTRDKINRTRGRIFNSRPPF